MSLKEIDVHALIRLKSCRSRLTSQQYKTLRGQVFAGDPSGAMKGLNTLLARASHDKEEMKQ